jgi:hypothetical protein
MNPPAEQSRVVIDDIAPIVPEMIIPAQMPGPISGEAPIVLDVSALDTTPEDMELDEAAALSLEQDKKVKAMAEFLAALPRKYRKLLVSGRWSLLVKTDSLSRQIPIGLQRKSNGETRYFH